MKELSIEQKAKAYDEALERAEKALEVLGTDKCEGARQIFSLFPELKESEGEKVRKEIVEYLKKNLRLEWATWLEKQGKSSDQIHYWTEEEIEPIISDYLRGAEHYGGMIARLRCLKPKSLEKQGEPQDKGEISDGYHTFNELYYYRMLYNAAFFNMLPKEWVCKSKRHNDGEECFGGGWFIVMANLPTGQISNHYELKDWDLFQIPEKEVADKWDGHTPQKAADRLHKYLLEKQSEQKSQRMISAEAKEAMYDKPADKVEPKFKVKYAGSEYNVLEIKDIAGVAFYGIEDEPNHIDYVKAENCEIIDGYAIKENGSPYPTKSAVFFGAKNSTWSKEDDVMIYKLLAVVELYYDRDGDDLDKQSCIDWLKALKQRCAWKPSDEQLEALKNAIHIKPFKNPSDSILWRLYEQLKKLKS